MKKPVIVLFFVLIIGLSSVSAQNAANCVQPTDMQKLQEKVSDAEKSFQDCFDTDRTLKGLKEPLKSTIKNRHKNVKTALETIINMQQEQLLACQDTLAVFRFFSNTEETIFEDSTLERNGWSRKLTGTYLILYETISQIREVSALISEVENTINEETNNKEKEGLDDEKLKTIIKYKIETKMRYQIGRKMDELDAKDLSSLSDAQREYYRKLGERFNDIFDRYL